MSQTTFGFAATMRYPTINALLNAHGVSTYYQDGSGLIGFRWLGQYQWYAWHDHKGYIESGSTKTLKGLSVSKYKG